MQILLPLLLNEYKDQSLVKQIKCMWYFFVYQLNFYKFQVILGSNKFC